MNKDNKTNNGCSNYKDKNMKKCDECASEKGKGMENAKKLRVQGKATEMQFFFFFFLGMEMFSVKKKIYE